MIKLTAALLCLALPALAQSPQDVLRRDFRADGPAAVAYLWTPREELSAATGTAQRGGEPTRPQDRFAIASVSKLYLAVAMLRAQEQGLVDLDAPVAAYLPTNVPPIFGGLGGISTRMLLNMTAGLPDYLDDDYVMAMAQGGLSDPRRQALENAADWPRSFAPGTDFDYSNTNYVLAEMVLERVTGQHMSQSFRELIFTPAGLTRTAHHGPNAQPDVVGIEDGAGLSEAERQSYYTHLGLADGGLIAPAAEVAAFYRALFLDRSLLSDASLRELLTVAKDAYALGIEVETIPGIGRVYGHSGGDLGFAADVRIAVDLPAIAVILIADGNADADQTFDLLDGAR